MGDTYTHGHHASVLCSHEWRSVENSAGHLIPHLWSGQRLLDVGCGPGTITVDLAQRVAPGPVLGIDASTEVIARAAANLDPADRRSDDAIDVRFAVGDVYDLDADDASFDVVHAHQVLQHLTDPVGALIELRRVLTPDGILAVRDADYGGFVWSPADERLTRWLDLYHRVTVRNGAEADAGRHLGAWVRAAGFTDIEITTSAWTFADPESRAWWGGLWAERVEHSDLARQAVDYGLTDPAELADVAAAWRAWASESDGFFMVPNVEVIARP